MAEPACILLVEDEPLIAFALEDLVLELGYHVVGPAYRLDEALDLARTAPFDAAILDVNLNEQQSFPIAALLKERGIPFLFATGYAEGNLSGLGNAAVIAKPYGRDQLARALAAILA
ncbi:response regulator [Sphingomonas sp. LHG3406-1]|uniref:response regulator n=1 Tax=Sphingomonas sp. LHG3406-1 TaxID=2804617 RepID=UPI002636266C|nr:response regulator [Sphingomonas sp. LHG3406-1]